MKPKGGWQFHCLFIMALHSRRPDDLGTGLVDLLLANCVRGQSVFPRSNICTLIKTIKIGTLLDAVLDAIDGAAKTQALQQPHPMLLGYVEGLQPSQPGFSKDGLQWHDASMAQKRLKKTPNMAACGQPTCSKRPSDVHCTRVGSVPTHLLGSSRLMGGVPTLGLQSVLLQGCLHCLPNAGGVLGYFVPIRPDVACIRKVLIRHGATPKQVRTILVIFWECHVPLTPLSCMTQGTGLCQNRDARCMAP